MIVTEFDKNVISLFEGKTINFIENDSLHKGKSADTISCFIIARATGLTEFEKRGYELLELIGNNIFKNGSLNFNIGISGIGWMIEWLNQNKFIDCNTDDILQDIDNAMYNSLKRGAVDLINLEDGILCSANYFLIRYRSKYDLTPQLEHIYLGGCLSILTKDLRKKILSNPNFLDCYNLSNNKDELINTAHVLFYLGDLKKLRHSSKDVEDIYYFILEKIDLLLETIFKDKSNILSIIVSLQYLMIALYACSSVFNFLIWKKKSENALLNLMLVVEKENLPFSYHQNAIYSLSFASIDNLSVRTICKKNFAAISDKDSILQHLAFTSPDIINWKEIIRIWNI